MRAVVRDRYGSADALRLAEIDKPDIEANEVLVKVTDLMRRLAAGHVRGKLASPI